MNHGFNYIFKLSLRQISLIDQNINLHKVLLISQAADRWCHISSILAFTHFHLLDLSFIYGIQHLIKQTNKQFN